MSGPPAFRYLLATLLLVAGAAPAAPAAPGRPHPPAQTALDGVAADLTRHWAQGSAEGIGERLVASGIRLRLGHEDHQSMSRRQAIAFLRGYLSAHRTGGIRLENSSEVGGAPPRGYAEIVWDAMEEGASQSFRTTVYVGFVQEDEAWRVFEIRVLR